MIDEPPILPDDTQDVNAITQAAPPVDDHVTDAGDMVLADVIPDGVWYEETETQFTIYAKTDESGYVLLYAPTGWGRGTLVTIRVERGW